MSFDEKNAISLRDLQDLLVEVVRPEIDSGKREPLPMALIGVDAWSKRPSLGLGGGGLSLEGSF